MTPLNFLLTEYGASHQNPTNKLIHWVCVPLILFALLGLLLSVPVPAAVARRAGPWLNWATLVMAGALLYYLRLSGRLALGMVLVWLGLAAGLRGLEHLGGRPLWGPCLLIFALAWVGQFWGHRVEGKKPSFLKDVQFLLIGPLWLLHFVYQHLGWGY